jgi:hypothetical protein
MLMYLPKIEMRMMLVAQLKIIKRPLTSTHHCGHIGPGSKKKLGKVMCTFN